MGRPRCARSRRAALRSPSRCMGTDCSGCAEKHERLKAACVANGVELWCRVESLPTVCVIGEAQRSFWTLDPVHGSLVSVRRDTIPYSDRAATLGSFLGSNSFGATLLLPLLPPELSRFYLGTLHSVCGASLANADAACGAGATGRLLACGWGDCCPPSASRRARPTSGSACPPRCSSRGACARTTSRRRSCCSCSSSAATRTAQGLMLCYSMLCMSHFAFS